MPYLVRDMLDTQWGAEPAHWGWLLLGWLIAFVLIRAEHRMRNGK